MWQRGGAVGLTALTTLDGKKFKQQTGGDGSLLIAADERPPRRQVMGAQAWLLNRKAHPQILIFALNTAKKSSAHNSFRDWKIIDYLFFRISPLNRSVAESMMSSRTPARRRLRLHCGH
jgi:hypothetical protein